MFKSKSDTLTENELIERAKLLDTKEHELSVRESELTERENDYNARLSSLKTRETDADNDFPKRFLTKYSPQIEALDIREKICSSDEAEILRRRAELDARDSELKRKSRELDDRQADLTRRENALIAAESERDSGWAKELAEHQQELLRKRHESEKEIYSRVSQLIVEAESQLAGIRAEKLSQFQGELATQQAEIDKARKALEDEKISLQEKLSGIEFDRKRIESQKKSLDERESQIEAEIQKRTETLRAKLEEESRQLKNHIDSLHKELATQESLNAAYESLQRKLGGTDPHELLARLNAQEEALKTQRQELIDRPSETLRAEHRAITEERDNYKTLYEEAQDRLESVHDELLQKRGNEAKISELKLENESLQRTNEALQREVNRLTEEIRRLDASYEQEQNRDKRIANITRPCIDSPERMNRRNPDEPLSEIDWLSEIAAKSAEYGVKFPKRILYAFHTALKTAEWSPLTVLAGVSGTGKSELPRLYSHFGGLNFLPLSVQPNWDSQESMLGFFNSIDNNFDAQPALQLLAQSQLDHKSNPMGLNDTMTIILLDEMNLAHVELYFAEFLSKLELRRGEREVYLTVKLGAGVEPYRVNLGRNVLWVGTMNQDETTKTLSDKVLDRGIVINFPRPKKLESRSKLKGLGSPAQLIHRVKHWGSWKQQESAFKSGFAAEEIAKYKAFIEAVNDAMSYAGRALGHRVWQSIEYYMSNYPTVLASRDDPDSLRRAMKVSFEDALVQKVMPKLYGVATTGTHKEKCIDEIRKRLDEGINYEPFAIISDYDRATSFGYGQFMWNSAEYITAEDESD